MNKTKKRSRSEMAEKHKTHVYFSGVFIKKAFKNRVPRHIPVYGLDTMQLAYNEKEDSYWLEYIPQTAFWMSRWFEIPNSVGRRLWRSWESIYDN